MAELPQIYRPVPRRAFEITPATPISSDSSIPPSPEPMNAELLLDKRAEQSVPPSRTRSILNLTSSTLLGIYSPTAQGGRGDEISTPWGTGAQTPRKSLDDYRQPDIRPGWDSPQRLADSHWHRPKSRSRGVMALLARSALLFAFGIAYGTILTQLHKSNALSPVQTDKLPDRAWYFHVAWGLSGVILGNALPWVDRLWPKPDSDSAPYPSTASAPSARPSTPSTTDLAADWYAAVRGIGAFVGIAFAVRKVPWQSTLQVSLTLALANPVLWYLIDRSKAGFTLSAAVGVIGTIVLLAVNPDVVPLPAATLQQTQAFSESVGVFTWMASILFCTSVCFGAVGRKVQA